MRVPVLCLLLAGCATPDYCVEVNWEGRCVAWQIGPTPSQIRNFGK